MAKEKKKKLKHCDTASNKRDRIKREIKKAQKKLEKLLKLHTEGKKRWTRDRKGNKIDRKDNKTQGIISGSKRHKGLLEHITQLKSQV